MQQQRKQKNQIGQVPHEAAEGSNLEWRQRTKSVSYDETAQRAFYPSRYPHRPHYQAEEDPAYGYAYEHGHGSGAGFGEEAAVAGGAQRGRPLCGSGAQVGG